MRAEAEAQAGGKVEGENVLDDDEDNLFGQPEEVERFIGVGGSIRVRWLRLVRHAQRMTDCTDSRSDP